ncbi:hypothetical protein ACFXO9_27375 [Nocardia tengchongensis]|uniref:hypothetical protein n=1 Tax=Nocardia tengchongensis TaxID=2055889 RepID=UPI0036CF1DF7
MSAVLRKPLCDLFAAMAIELERRVSVETARSFKERAYQLNDRLAQLITQGTPEIDPNTGVKLGRGLIVAITGLWPYARPTEVLARAARDVGGGLGPDRFQQDLLDITTALLVGYGADSAPDTTEAAAAERPSG